MDTSTAAPPAAPASAPLVYPFEAPPARGETLEVAPGVLWIRMPLPFKLDHINLWAIDDGAGWAVVDTGVRNEESIATWRSLFSRSPDNRPITRVIVTHMHPDHVGMAGWLTRKFDCRLWMTRLEYLSCRALVADTGREAPADALAFYRRAGWSEAATENYKTRFGDFGKLIYALPDSYRRMCDGDVMRIGRHDWRVITGSGHCPEHACLYSEELKLLISGDQVLPRISSNVSVYPMEPDADPMAEWLASLDKIEREVPDDVLVLPAHNDCFRGLHARIANLRRGQHTALERLRRRLDEPRRAVDVFTSLFGRPIDETNVPLLGMATGESLACLNYLVGRGEAHCALDAGGVAWYRALAPRATPPA
jgi:glyoxylase-like metal-dependent hydrolase (beta-lactamase superfamily II)